MRTHFRVVGLLLCGACAGSNRANELPRPLDVSGTYATAVTLLSSSCSGITVENRQTVVAMQSGSSAFKLTHAGLPFDGIVRADGGFTIRETPINAGSSVSYLGMTGKFSIDGFIATVTVNVANFGRPNCQYKVRWVGAKL